VGPSRREWLWYLACFASGSALWGLAALRLSERWNSELGLPLLLWTGITFITLFRQVRLSDEAYHSVYTLDDVPLYALIFLYGWEPAVLVAGFTRLGFELFRLFRAWYKHPERVHFAHVIFHFSDVPMAVNVAAAAGLTYGSLACQQPLLEGVRSWLALLSASLAWFAVAFSQNSLALTLRRQLPLSWAFAILRQNFRHIRLHLLMLVPLGALLAIFWASNPAIALLLIVPLALMHNALEAQHKLRLESVSTIQALARYLEERDPYTQGHSARVAGYAAALAEVMNFDSEQVEQVRRAGLIHDVGKVAIPDAILRKPGSLTESEKAIMRTHTDRAVELVRQLVSLGKELPFREAAYHHENFDGTGHYRILGDEIPMISSILAVADTFDALT